MTYRFEYRFYNKYIVNKEAGFGIIIDDEFETIEILTLSSMNKVLESKYVYISSHSKDRIKTLLTNYNEIYTLSSYLYLDGINKEHEQLFYFELNNKNRKIEGCNIFEINNDNVEARVLLNVFNKVSDILREDGINLKLDKIKNDK